MNHKKFLFFALTLLINSNGYNALEGEAILGGEETQKDEYLYTVSLQRNNKNVCAGGIIASYYVVTAAHCVVKPNLEFIREPLLVVGGTTDLNAFPPKRSQVYVAEASIPSRFHASTTTIRTGDIAVLRLSEPVSFGPNSRLELPAFYENAEGLTAIVTGFGWNEVTKEYDENGEVRESGKTHGKMRFAHTQILRRDRCETLEDNEVPWAVLCAQFIQRNLDEIEGVCEGDSGGPLVVKRKLVGVVNYSPVGCDEKFSPSLYARVSSYSNFIEKVLNKEYDPLRISNILPIPEIQTSE